MGNTAHAQAPTKKSSQAYYDTNKNSSLSIGLSIGLHVLAFVALKYSNFENTVIPPVEEKYVDLGYQEFEEPPQIVQDVKQVEVKPDIEEPVKADPTPVAAQEMQDQSSDVAGLQKETPKEAPKTTVVSNTNFTDVPYYKVKPRYPKEALAQGIEGHVLMQIDILQDGSVENLKVLSGDKLNVFETEARRAVSKYKYKPFMDDAGAPIVKHNHLVRVEFKLVDAVN
ncbi:MAG: TonB family protein [Bdellovibrionaceae bacterium]|nr:TonB family protein [Pseudobdellovibrionaceae bacterium]